MIRLIMVTSYFKSLPVVSSVAAWWEFRKLKQYRRDTSAHFRKLFLEYAADKTKTREDVQVLEADEYHTMKEIDEELDRARSQRLLAECIKYDIEIPQNPDSWRHSEDGTYNYLSPKGRAQLRNLLREEKAKSSQEFGRWLPYITAISGLIGVLIGLVAAWKR